MTMTRTDDSAAIKQVLADQYKAWADQLFGSQADSVLTQYPVQPVGQIVTCINIKASNPATRH